MTHAGAWLLAEDITKYSLQAAVTCALLRGVTKTHILDLKNFTGDLYSVYEDCVAYAQAKLNTALIPHIHGRDERLELPEDAIREALVNAIAHRDYRSTANVQMYPIPRPSGDRDAGWVARGDAGGRPGDQERTGAIACCSACSTAWAWWSRSAVGSGAFAQECHDYGVAEPLIEVSEHWVTTTFRRPESSTGTPGRVKGATRTGAEQIEVQGRHQVGTKSAPSIDPA